jgi:hypothetical protein
MVNVHAEAFGLILPCGVRIRDRSTKSFPVMQMDRQKYTTARMRNTLVYAHQLLFFLRMCKTSTGSSDISITKTVAG